MIASVELCTKYGGFCEINLNSGCPSTLVSSRSFGARLMLEPQRVHDICSRMIASSIDPHNENNLIPITVKCRLGVDDHDSYEQLYNYIKIVATSGVQHFIVHARKCLLNGLNPKENRTIPPLKYEWVYRLKHDFPSLSFTLNGGIQSLEHAKELLETTNIDGIMIGRAAYNRPWDFRDADRMIFGQSNPNLSRREIITQYLEYAEEMQKKWGDTIPKTSQPFSMPTTLLIKPLLTLFAGEVGGKAFKRIISDRQTKKGPKPSIRELIEEAMTVIPDNVLDLRIEDELKNNHI